MQKILAPIGFPLRVAAEKYGERRATGKKIRTVSVTRPNQCIALHSLFPAFDWRRVEERARREAAATKGCGGDKGGDNKKR